MAGRRASPSEDATIDAARDLADQLLEIIATAKSGGVVAIAVAEIMSEVCSQQSDPVKALSELVRMAELFAKHARCPDCGGKPHS